MEVSCVPGLWLQRGPSKLLILVLMWKGRARTFPQGYGARLSQFAQDCGISQDTKLSVLKLEQPQANQEELVTLPRGVGTSCTLAPSNCFLLTLQPSVATGLELAGQHYTILAGPQSRSASLSDVHSWHLLNDSL